MSSWPSLSEPCPPCSGAEDRGSVDVLEVPRTMSVIVAFPAAVVPRKPHAITAAGSSHWRGGTTCGPHRLAGRAEHPDTRGRTGSGWLGRLEPSGIVSYPGHLFDGCSISSGESFRCFSPTVADPHVDRRSNL